MNNTPQHLKDKWKTEIKKCERFNEGNCAGRITKEHAIIFAGKQVQEDWAILNICEYHHSVNKYQDTGDLNKEKHIYLALCKAQNDDLKRISKAIDYIALRERLKQKYDNT